MPCSNSNKVHIHNSNTIIRWVVGVVGVTTTRLEEDFFEILEDHPIT
jgi:hypothetical protein